MSKVSVNQLATREKRNAPECFSPLHTLLERSILLKSQVNRTSTKRFKNKNIYIEQDLYSRV